LQAAPDAKMPRMMKAGTAYLPGLKKAREKRDISIRELAYEANVSSDTVWKLETLQRAAEQKTRRKLARALDVGIKELMKTEEDARR
jgi:ribosome-binding protein aMBF1 (putative translation factor)